MATDRSQPEEYVQIFYIWPIGALIKVIATRSYCKLYIIHGVHYLLITMVVGAITNLSLNVIFILYSGLLAATITSFTAYAHALALRQCFSRSVVRL